MNSSKEEKIILINNNDILPNRYQPRKKFSEDELLDLTESIKKYGILEPIIVRPLGDKYELVAGERRYKANVLAGNESIPARIVNLDDAECSEIAIIENLQRKELSALEEALSYKRAIDLGYANQKQLAEKIGKSQSYVANKIRLLKLSDEVQDALIENKISERHARSLLKINNLEDQNKMLNKIITERLTVRRTDEEIEKMINDNNIPNSGDLPTTPLSTIFNEDNNQPVNPNGVFTFGPENTLKNDTQPLMSFDLNGNPVSNDTNNDDSTSGSQFNMFSAPEATPVQPMATEPQAVEQPQPFNMFASPEATPVQPMATEPQAVEQPQPFNMYASPEATPVQPMATEPQAVEQPQPFNMFASPEATPVQSMGAEPQVTEQPQSFDLNNSQIPQTPIFDANQQNDNIAEFTKPDPIIVTDYSKQYDPVMPNSQSQIPEIDMKTIINLIRQCSDTIEKCGYKIDTEEYDLENMYQVVFKIDKK